MKKNVICFDYGKIFTGVAIGQYVTNTATPCGVIVGRNSSKSILQLLEKIFAHWQPHIIVVGWPLNMDGSIQPFTQQCNNFGKLLSSHFKLPIEFHDERLTTYAAKRQINTKRHSCNKHKIYGSNRFYINTPHMYDAISAAIILEDWLNK